MKEFIELYSGVQRARPLISVSFRLEVTKCLSQHHKKVTLK